MGDEKKAQVVYFGKRKAPAEDLPVVGISKRSTTSSRKPGKAIEGNVHYRIGRIVKCPDCPFFMRETGTGYPHGVRFEMLEGRIVKVDCAGRIVED